MKTNTKRMGMYLQTAVAMVVACCAMLVSCQKAVIDEEGGEGEPSVPNLLINVKGFAIIPFDATRASSDVANYCTRLNFVVYQNGKKVKAVNQQAGDEGFGTVALALAPGSYQVLVLGHSSNGNPSLATPEKVQFTNDIGFTDTFFYYQVMDIGDQQKSCDVVLERATSMFRLITTDKVPAAVEQLRFYYTGGSGALDATMGYGCVNSKQIVFFDVTPDMKGQPLRLEAYTIPRAQTGTLVMTVTAYGKDATVLYERNLNVPIERNRITEFTGNFFSNGDEGKGDDQPGEDNGQQTCTVRLNAAWDGVQTIAF